MPHKDKYRSFEELRGYEERGAYGIVAKDRTSDVLVLSPHGGGIEPGVSAIVKEIARDDLSFYLFEGRKKACNYATLHITSSRFDEPRCLDMLGAAQSVVAIHGCAGDDPVVYLGGLDESLSQRIGTALSGAGYDARTGGHQFPGKNPRNVCNRGQQQAGVQLELTKALRDDLDIERFAEAIRSVILAP